MKRIVFLLVVAAMVIVAAPVSAQWGSTNPFDPGHEVGTSPSNRNQDVVIGSGGRMLRCNSRGFVAGPEVSTVQVSETGDLLPRNGSPVTVHDERELSFQLVYWDWTTWRWRGVATVRFVHRDFAQAVYTAWQVGQLVRVETSGPCSREVYSPSRIAIID